MTRLSTTVRVSDHFCGMGGNSQGVVEAGAEIEVAVNHNKRACETYAANHRAVDVRQTDLLNADPRMHPRTDILIASPECRMHSPARGKKPLDGQWRLWDDDAPLDPDEERSRMTMRSAGNSRFKRYTRP